MNKDINFNTNLNEDLIEQRKEIEDEISFHYSIVQRYEALERLLLNDDFINVIINGFVKEKSNEMMNQLLTPRDKRSIDKEEANLTLESISMLNKYIGFNEIKGDLYYDYIRSKDAVFDLTNLLNQRK